MDGGWVAYHSFVLGGKKVNVYDTANKLAYELKNSEECKNYKELKKKVEEDINLKEKLDHFEKLRYEVQLAGIKGLEQDKEKATAMQTEYAELIQNDIMKQYFDAELKFNVILTDVNKIIGEAVQDLIE
jgi:cell fate (sporulation/competence/biofilm development) regulator YlbF (YheA/YmcA/DUF963 family)